MRYRLIIVRINKNMISFKKKDEVHNSVLRKGKKDACKKHVRSFFFSK